LPLAFASCNERVTVSDADALGLKSRVKTLNESFYLSRNAFDSIVLQQEIYSVKYEFHNNCNFKSIEKNFPCNSNAGNVPDSLKKAFPFAFMEQDYSILKYRYLSDSVTSLECFGKNNELQYKIVKNYKNDRLATENKYSGQGALLSKSGFWYDDKGRMINKTVFYRDSYAETHYAYMLKEKLESDNDFIYKYTYDINGTVVNKKTYKGANLTTETYFFYNEHNDVVTVKEIDSDGALRKTLYEYTYDENKNWIMRVEHNYTGNIFVTKREITYY
jgi:hypothetical protein